MFRVASIIAKHKHDKLHSLIPKAERFLPFLSVLHPIILLFASFQVLWEAVYGGEAAFLSPEGLLKLVQRMLLNNN